MPVETGFGEGAKKRSRKTAHTVVYGTTSSTVDFDVTRGNVLVEFDAPSDGSGDITWTYTLRNPRADNASIIPEYSVDGGNTYSTATSAGGDDGVDNLTTSSAGVEHTFIHDTVNDLGIDFKGDVFVRIKAYDRVNQGGDFEYSEAHKLNVDNAPLAPTIVSPTSGYFDKNETPTFVFTIPSPNEGNSNLHVKLEIDPESTFDSSLDPSGNSIPLKTFESRLDQVGWEYDSDGNGAWVDVPHDGIPIIATPALIGNQARFTIPTEERLSAGKYFYRVVFGGVTS